jgi:hypothetical protein
MEERLHKTRKMNITELKKALDDNNIDESSYLILPSRIVEGPISLLMTDDGQWRVVESDRGEFVIDRVFACEDAAARYFLKQILLDPTARKGFNQHNIPANYDEWVAQVNTVLANYGIQP